MIPQKPDQQGQPRGSYLVVAAIVIGVALGIALASVTRQPAFMLGGLVAGAAIAYWLARPRP
jgi:F0F1-type ATP synthase assembly protein I